MTVLGGDATHEQWSTMLCYPLTWRRQNIVLRAQGTLDNHQ